MTAQLLRLILVASALAAGCAEDKPPPGPPADPEAEIRAHLAALGPADQRLAERQQYCPLMEGVRLGETGPIYKVTVKGVSAFVCCRGCARSAEQEPDQALAKIRDLEGARAKDPARHDP
jgi:hypothetical protein